MKKKGRYYMKLGLLSSSGVGTSLRSLTSRTGTQMPKVLVLHLQGSKKGYIMCKFMILKFNVNFYQNKIQNQCFVKTNVCARG